MFHDEAEAFFDAMGGVHRYRLASDAEAAAARARRPVASTARPTLRCPWFLIVDILGVRRDQAVCPESRTGSR